MAGLGWKVFMLFVFWWTCSWSWEYFGDVGLCFTFCSWVFVGMFNHNWGGFWSAILRWPLLHGACGWFFFRKWGLGVSVWGWPTTVVCALWFFLISCVIIYSILEILYEDLRRGLKEENIEIPPFPELFGAIFPSAKSHEERVGCNRTPWWVNELIWLMITVGVVLVVYCLS